MPPFLKEKRNELIWALAKQGYNGAQISQIFNIARSTAHEIIKAMPEGWETPWRKVK